MKFRKILAITIAALLVVFNLTSCGQDSAKKTEDGGKKVKVVTTIFPQYDFARNVLKDKGEVKMLLKPGAESHSFEPTPKDIKDIENADVFIYTGGENDVWVKKILKSLGKKAPRTIELLDCTDTVEEETVEGMEHEHHHDEHHEGEHEIDEHVWTSPVNAVKIVEKITDTVSEVDKADKAYFEKNSQAYIKKLKDLDKSFEKVVKEGKRRTILFGDRFPFRYFADRYNLKYYAAFSGCSTETEANASTVKFLIKKVKDEKIPVVFTIEMSDKKIAGSVADATGAKNLTLHSCHNLTKNELEKGEDYISMMKKNIDSLKEALK